MKTYIPIYDIEDHRKDGEWTLFKEEDKPHTYAKCTHCDFVYVYQKGSSKKVRHYKYCPNCGRRMHISRETSIKKIDYFPFL